MRRTILSAVLASVLVLSGCGESEEDKAKTELSSYLIDQQKESQMVDLKKDESDCIADGMVDGIGVDQLKEYGLLNEDATVNKDAETPKMSQKDAEVMVDSMFECTDVMATMQEQLSSAAGGQTPEVRTCLEDALDEEVVRGVLVGTFTGEQEQAQQDLMAALGACLAPGTPQPEG